MLYRVNWVDKNDSKTLPEFIYIDDGSIFDNMFSAYIRNVAANAEGGNVVQLIDYRNNDSSDFCNLPECYKSFLEDHNNAHIKSFSYAYNVDVVKYVEENGIYIS